MLLLRRLAQRPASTAPLGGLRFLTQVGVVVVAVGVSAGAGSTYCCYYCHNLFVQGKVAVPSFSLARNPKEPSGPKMVTTVPGPASKKLGVEMGAHVDVSALHFFIDYDKAQGNYLVGKHIYIDILYMHVYTWYS